MELQRLGHQQLIEQRCGVLDTLVLAKQKHPGQKNNLDALCKRYGVNNANRTLHGALLDAELLAFVYLAMTGGQINLFAQDKVEQAVTRLTVQELHSNSPVYFASAEEQAAHDAFMAELAR